MAWLVGLWSLILAPTGCGPGPSGHHTETDHHDQAFASRRCPPLRGVNFVAPRVPIALEDMQPVTQTGANWIAIVPYGFTYAGSPRLIFDTARQWWGETPVGAAEQIRMARELDLKIMLKPQVWVIGQGWAGDFDLPGEAQWQQWERNYRRFMMTYARIADTLDVELLCLGTEYRIAARKRPDFWRGLSDSIRRFYEGQLTYAANWDNFDSIAFWDALDFAGIDAYFPLTAQEKPTAAQLDSAWGPHWRRLVALHQRTGKPVLFTEYGYLSAAGALREPWESAGRGVRVDMALQQKGLEALYRNFWPQEWFAGGFLWKWHATYRVRGGPSDAGYTPQNKPALETIRYWYGAQ